MPGDDAFGNQGRISPSALQCRAEAAGIGFRTPDAPPGELRCPQQSRAFGVHSSATKHESRRLWTAANLAALREERTVVKAILIPKPAFESSLSYFTIIHSQAASCIVAKPVARGWLQASPCQPAPAPTRMAPHFRFSTGRTATGRQTAAITGPLMHLKRTVFPDKPADCFRSGESGRDASWLHAVDRMQFRLDLAPGLSQNRRLPVPNSPAKTATPFRPDTPVMFRSHCRAEEKTQNA